MIVLNIGLNIGNTEALTLAQVVQAIERQGLPLIEAHLGQSETERTAIAVIDLPEWDSEAVFTLSTVLAQDAIAVCHAVTRQGAVIGPQAAAWGEFNPEFFLWPRGLGDAPLGRLLRDIQGDRPTLN